jgi:Cu+-exporting ATPase
LADAAETAAAKGQTVVFVAIDGVAAGVISVSDPVKPEAARTVADLHARGVKVAMITGDGRITGQAIATELGIDHVFADATPDSKVQILTELQAAGPVAFVGDGINDAPALAAADVGIAIGTGTDVAIETADVVLMTGDTGGVARALTLSQETMRNIRQNLAWAFGYNVLLIPLAGILLSPMLAAGAMAISSVAVVTNALRLKRAGGQRGPSGPAPRKPSLQIAEGAA